MSKHTSLAGASCLKTSGTSVLMVTLAYLEKWQRNEHRVYEDEHTIAELLKRSGLCPRGLTHPQQPASNRLHAHCSLERFHE